MHITITLKRVVEFYALAKRSSHLLEDLRVAFQSTPSSKDTNTLKFAEVWNSKMTLTPILQRVERSGEDFARLLAGPPEKNVFRPMIGATEKNGKNNINSLRDRVGEKAVIQRVSNRKRATYN